MIAPTGVLANGVVQGGALAYLLSVQGIGVGGQSHLIALLGIPTWLYFAWSPITDFFVKRRTWLLIGGLGAAVLIVLAFHEPHLTSRSAVVLMFVSACLVQLVVSSCGGIMAGLRSDVSRERAGSFYQAGSQGFGALSAWVLVYMSSRVSQGTLGWIAGAMIALPTLSALAAPAQQAFGDGSFGESLRRVGVEFKRSFWTRRAIPYLVYMLLPAGTGSAIGLLPGVAAQYHVSGDSVAWMNGLAGGLLLAGGALSFAAAPWLLGRLRLRVSVLVLATCIYLVNAVTLAILWLGHLDPRTYFIGLTLYLFTVGMCVAGFTAVILEFMGDAGKSGSTRYSLINSLGNVPVQYMILADGWGGDHFGVGVALERHNQVRQGFDGKPFPFRKFRLRRRDIDVGIGAGETQRDPFLALAAITAVQRDAEQVLRQVVGQPLVHLAQKFGLVGAGLFLQFAKACFAGRFAIVDSALRHLPALDSLVDPLADENAAVRVDQHHTDARAVRQIFMAQMRLTLHRQIRVCCWPVLWPMRAPEQSPGRTGPAPTRRAFRS